MMIFKLELGIPFGECTERISFLCTVDKYETNDAANEIAIMKCFDFDVPWSADEMFEESYQLKLQENHKLADAWYDSLTPKHKEYIRILQSQMIATG